MAINETQIAVNFEGIDHEISSLKHRMDKSEEIQGTIHKLASSVDKLADSMVRMATEQEAQGKRLTTLEQAPAEAFKDYKKTVINCIITGVVSFIVGALLTMIIK